MSYTADCTTETTEIRVRPDRGGFLNMEVAYSKRHRMYVVRLMDSDNYFTKHTSYERAFRSALHRARRFDGYGVTTSQQRRMKRVLARRGAGYDEPIAPDWEKL